MGPGFGGWFHIRVCVVLFAGKIARRGAGVQGKVWGHLAPEIGGYGIRDVAESVSFRLG